MTGGGMEMFATLMMLGVRVREVCALAEGSLWLPSERLLLVDSELTTHERVRVNAHFLPEVLGVDQTERSQ